MIFQILEYSCHGWWEDEGVSYLVTSPVSRATSRVTRYCFIFKEEPSVQSPVLTTTSFSLASHSSEPQLSFQKVILISTSEESCRRDIAPGIEGRIAFNVTGRGMCFFFWVMGIKSTF